MKKTVITISREYGSGGRIIGKKLAEALGISFYDGELLSLVAKESGYTEEFVRQNASDMIFIAQSRVIKDLHSKESCVIVGRCADYVLRGKEDVINIFIHAPIESRAERVKTEYGEQADNYVAHVKKKDKSRVAYYNYFADDSWGKVQTYDLSVNSDVGVDNAVKIIVDYVKAKQGE